MLRLTALLTVLGSVVADSENCLQPQFGARRGRKRREARELAFSQIADGVDVKVKYDGSDRSAKDLSSDACNGITHGLEDDGCYALETPTRRSTRSWNPSIPRPSARRARCRRS